MGEKFDFMVELQFGTLDSAHGQSVTTFNMKLEGGFNLVPKHFFLKIMLSKHYCLATSDVDQSLIPFRNL